MSSPGIGLYLTAAALLAGQTSPATQTPSFRTEARLVVLYATVTNSRGELVSNLDRRVFTVLDNGTPQPITLFRNDDVPVSIGLLIDNSGSMRTRRRDVEAAALAFARASNPDDELFVLNFADHWRVDVPMTSNIGAIEAGIARVDSIGGTALRDAVQAGESYLNAHAKWERRALLVISDGNDNGSTIPADLLRRALEQSDTVVFAIGVSGGATNAAAGRSALRALTERTGGTASFPADDTQLEATAVALAHQIRTQYTVGYSPMPDAPSGAYRSIRLVVRGPDRYTVRTRAGYRTR